MTVATTENEDIGLITDTIDNSPFTLTQALVIIMALSLNMLEGYDITAMSFTAHSVGEQMSISADQMGYILSIALFGMMMGAMFIAPYSDVIGRRKMILACVMTIGICVLLTGLTTSFWQLIILRGLTGLAVGGLLASIAAITSEYTPARYKTFAVVIVTGGFPLGATVGGFIAAPMIPAFGWPSVFIFGGITTLLLGFLVYLLMPESMQFLITRRPPHALDTLNRILVRLGKTPEDKLPEIDIEAHSDKANVISLLTPERRIRTINLWMAFFFCFISLYFLSGWIPKLVVDAGMTESDGVYASVAYNGGAFIGIITLGLMSAHISLSRVIGTYQISSGIIMIIFALASGINHLFIYLFVIGFLLQGGFTGMYAVAAKIYPTEIRSTGVGWAIGLGRFGAVAGPIIGGYLIAQGVSMETNFIIYGIPMLIAGTLAYILRVR